MGDTPIGAARYPNEHLTADMNAGIVYGVVLPVNSEISRDAARPHRGGPACFDSLETWSQIQA